jgi:hypothetical protein
MNGGDHCYDKWGVGPQQSMQAIIKREEAKLTIFGSISM